MTSKALPNWIIGILLLAVFILIGELHQSNVANRKLKARLAETTQAMAVAAHEEQPESAASKPLQPSDPFQAYQPPSDVTSAYERLPQLPAEGAAPPDL